MFQVKNCPIFELYEASVFCERLLVKKQKKKQLNLYRCSIIRKWGRSSHTSWRINKRAIEKITLMDSPFIGGTKYGHGKTETGQNCWHLHDIDDVSSLLRIRIWYKKGNDVINEYSWRWILTFPTSRLPPWWAICRWGILISRYINIAHPGYNTFSNM